MKCFLEAFKKDSPLEIAIKIMNAISSIKEPCKNSFNGENTIQFLRGKKNHLNYFTYFENEDTIDYIRQTLDRIIEKRYYDLIEELNRKSEEFEYEIFGKNTFDFAYENFNNLEIVDEKLTEFSLKICNLITEINERPIDEKVKVYVSIYP